MEGIKRNLAILSYGTVEGTARMRIFIKMAVLRQQVTMEASENQVFTTFCSNTPLYKYIHKQRDNYHK